MRRIAMRHSFWLEYLSMVPGTCRLMQREISAMGKTGGKGARLGWRMENGMIGKCSIIIMQPITWVQSWIFRCFTRRRRRRRRKEMEARIFNQPTENMSRHVSPFNDLDIEVRTECRNVPPSSSPRVLDSTTPRDSLLTS